MKIYIFDVEHGFCAFLVATNGNNILVDCGHNTRTGFHPGDYLLVDGHTKIDRFFVTNYDEDHVSGLPRLRELHNRLPIRILHRNKSITPDQLEALKRRSGPLRPGILALLEMAREYTGDVEYPPEYPGIEYNVFVNEYPAFSDTNNLSLVLFVHYSGVSIVFPGDLEKAGWAELLKQESFRRNLSRVNIFVASHHGRDSGYYPDVFDYCTPNIVIISDEAKQYATQEDNYREHAVGIRWNDTGTRKVLTTRKDGMLMIASDGTGYHVTAHK